MFPKPPTILTVLLALLPTGCERPAPTTAGGAGTRQLALPDGGSLTLPQRPMRVLPATAGATDLVVELLDPARVVALPVTAPAWSIVGDEPERWAHTPVLQAFTGEAVLTLEPDLLLVSSWTDPSPLAVLRGAGIPVLELPDARTWEGLLDSVRLLGEALDEVERAHELVSSLEGRRAALAATEREPLSILPYANFGTGGTTSGLETTLDLAIRLAGFENAAATAGIRRHEGLSLEQVLDLDPDVFLTSSGRDGVTAGATYLRGEQALAGLRAIREGRIVVLPAELFGASSQRVLDAAEALAAAVEAWRED
jgi:ABC-type Fe3+-hydroxamate transport system substrate-binding protein